MDKDRILFVDTETGGVDPEKHSLLSIGMIVWEDFKLLDSTEILINPENLSITDKAMEINGIDLNVHAEIGVNETEAVKLVCDFVKRNFDVSEKVTLAGHNVGFDIGFLKVLFELSPIPFSKLFSHRYIDTASVLYFLYLNGNINKKAISSQAAFDLFGVHFPERHSALSDARATATLFGVLLKKTLRKKKIKDSKEDGQIDMFG